MSNAKKTSICQSNEDPQYHLDKMNELRYYMDVNNMIVYDPDHDDPDVDDPLSGDLHFLDEGNTGDDDDRVDDNEIQSAVAEHITDIHNNDNEDRRIVIPTIDKYDCVAHFHRFFRLKFVDVAVNMSDVKATHYKWNEDPQYHQDQMNDEDIINNLNEVQCDMDIDDMIVYNPDHADPSADDPLSGDLHSLDAANTQTQSDVTAHTSVLQNKSDIRNIAKPQVQGFHADEIDKWYDEACARPDIEYDNADC